MHCIINQSHALPGHADAFERMYLALLESGDLPNAPGFVSAHLLAPSRSGEPYRTVMLWADEASWKAYLRSDAARQSLGGLNRGLTGAAPVLEGFRVLASWRTRR